MSPGDRVNRTSRKLQSFIAVVSISAIAMGLIACGDSTVKEDNGPLSGSKEAPRPESTKRTYKSTSMIRLIASPEKHFGDFVEVWGVVLAQRESVYLYFDETASSDYVYSNALQVDLGPSELPDDILEAIQGQKIYVYGKFAPGKPNKFPDNGRITEIEAVFFKYQFIRTKNFGMH